MATYLYRCNCMKDEVEVSQPMREDAFTSCLQIYERLGQKAPQSCVTRGGCAAERLIAGVNGVLVKGARSSCSIGEKASSCGACCSAGAASGATPHCPFG